MTTCIHSSQYDPAMHQIVGGPYATEAECNSLCGATTTTTTTTTTSTTTTTTSTTSTTTTVEPFDLNGCFVLAYRASPCQQPPQNEMPLIRHISVQQAQMTISVVFDTFEQADSLDLSYIDSVGQEVFLLQTGFVGGSQLNTVPDCNSPGNAPKTYTFTKPAGVTSLKMTITNSQAQNNISGIYLAICEPGGTTNAPATTTAAPTTTTTTTTTAAPTTTTTTTTTTTSTTTTTTIPPVSACCFSDGSCIDNQFEGNCISQGGIWHDGVSCQDANC